MAKRAAKTPKQVLQPKVAASAATAPTATASAVAALTPEQLAANASATSSTHTPQSEDQGGAGNGAGPAGGDHAALDGGVLVVTTKRPQRWRAGRRFAKGEEVRIPFDQLTEADFRAITEDPVLEARVEPG